MIKISHQQTKQELLEQMRLPKMVPILQNARKDGEGEYGVVRLNEGGSIDTMENNLLNNGIAAVNSVNGMVSSNLQLEKDIANLGNTGGDYYANAGGSGIGQNSPFFRSDIDRVVDLQGLAGAMISSLSISQFNPLMNRLEATLGVQVQAFGLIDPVLGTAKEIAAKSDTFGIWDRQATGVLRNNNGSPSSLKYKNVRGERLSKRTLDSLSKSIKDSNNYWNEQLRK